MAIREPTDFSVHTEYPPPERSVIQNSKIPILFTFCFSNVWNAFQFLIQFLQHLYLIEGVFGHSGSDGLLHFHGVSTLLHFGRGSGMCCKFANNKQTDSRVFKRFQLHCNINNFRNSFKIGQCVWGAAQAAGGRAETFFQGLQPQLPRVAGTPIFM